jgi:hypothetical protein
MPSTSQNITLIEGRVSNYGRPEILAVLDELQKIIVEGDGTQRLRSVDVATGMPPALTTVAGTRHYTCPSNCRIVSAVFTESPVAGYTADRQRGTYGEYLYDGTRYLRWALAQVTEALLGVDATLTFVDDPGDTTNVFFLDYYLKVASLDTEQVELSLPEHTHFYLREGVIAILRGESYGPTGFDLDMIEKVARKVRNKLNRGGNARSKRTPWQLQDRDYF